MSDDMRWTPAQRNAVISKGRRLLVSAAAGSGKTSVLVGHVINKICDTESKTDITDLLIVTYTEAASEEMRNKIYTRLNEILQENAETDNIELRRHIKRQLTLLTNANISSVHSFCHTLIKQYFNLLDISPDMTVADENESSITLDKVIDAVITANYEAEGEKGELFSDMCEIFTGEKTDLNINEMFKSIYYFSVANPFPKEWLNEKVKMYDPENIHAVKTWQNILVNHTEKTIKSIYESAVFCDEAANGEMKAISADIILLKEIESTLKEADYEAIRSLIYNAKRERISKSGFDEEEYSTIKEIRERYWASMKGLSAYFEYTTEEIQSEMRRMCTTVNSIKETVIQIMDEYIAEKRRLRRIDFSDMEHLALELLIEKDSYDIKNKTFIKTPVAAEIISGINEIIVDEYQDSNETQDTLFRALSKGEKNIFMVGDVKQSIYSFRLTMPEIFMKYVAEFKEYEKAESGESAKINLDANFRSRKEVINVVNMIFENLMTEEFGGVDYNEDEKLKQMADYNESENGDMYETELCLIELEAEQENEDENNGYENINDSEESNGNETDSKSVKNARAEAKYIAGRIVDMLTSKQKIKDKNGEYREINFGDITILLRKVKDTAVIFEEELKKNNIPVTTSESASFFYAPEILTVLALLKVTDNPLSEIELAAVMMSPIFGYTLDDLVNLKTDTDRRMNLYRCVTSVAESGDIKYSAMLEKIEKYREWAREMPTDRLLWAIYDDTDYMLISAGLKGGNARKNNLMLLYEYAKKYEENGYKGLSAFIRYVDRIIETDKDMASSKDNTETNTVRIVSVHKAKGLEYPICFAAGLGNTINRNDLQKALLMDREYGFGFYMKDETMSARYDTFQRNILKIVKSSQSLSEEMRILYVTLTRAREKLIMVASVKDCEKKLNAMKNDIIKGKVSFDAMSAVKMPLDWIIYAAMIDKGISISSRIKSDMIDEMTGKVTNKTDSQLAIKYINEIKSTGKIENEANETESTDTYYDMEKIKNNLKYKYRNETASKLPAKLTVTELKGKHFTLLDEYADEEQYYKITNDEQASDLPDFMYESGETDKLTPKERGNAIHTFMEYADYQKCKEKNGIKSEIERLINGNYMSKAMSECISINKLKKFFDSNIACEIIAAKEFYREKKFNILLPPSLFMEIEEETEEKVILQGVIDCYYLNSDGEYTLIDFKTDKVKSEIELIDAYEFQLELYSKAIEEMSGKSVGKKVIYSFHLGKEVEL